jgi:hypothetical protein
MYEGKMKTMFGQMGAVYNADYCVVQNNKPFCGIEALMGYKTWKMIRIVSDMLDLWHTLHRCYGKI